MVCGQGIDGEANGWNEAVIDARHHAMRWYRIDPESLVAGAGTGGGADGGPRPAAACA